MRPLRPATDRSLGRPLPYQLANRPQPPPSAPLPALLPRACAPGTVCGISSAFAGLSPTEGQVSYVLLTRSPLYLVSQYCYRETVLVRLACVRHAASVDSEPGSNSRLKLSSLRPLAAKNRQPRFEAFTTPPTDTREGFVRPNGPDSVAQIYRRGTLNSIVKELRFSTPASRAPRHPNPARIKERTSRKPRAPLLEESPKVCSTLRAITNPTPPPSPCQGPWVMESESLRDSDRTRPLTHSQESDIRTK